MSFAIVTVPAAPIRRKPRHQREMTNQLLFGEAVEVLKEKDALWLKVRSLHDNYEGWVTRTLLEEVDEEQTRFNSRVLATGLLNTITIDGVAMHIPMGSSLPGLENGNGAIGQKKYSYAGASVVREQQEAGGELSEQLALQWLNAPYLWGGRSLFGVDCSGFVQVNFKLMGIDLPRDAWQQAQEGHSVKKLREAVKGDLAFFDDKEEIVHVGILLSPDLIIHASGKVRIDNIDKKGIIHSGSGKRTHSLRAIKRILEQDSQD